METERKRDVEKLCWDRKPAHEGHMQSRRSPLLLSCGIKYTPKGTRVQLRQSARETLVDFLALIQPLPRTEPVFSSSARGSSRIPTTKFQTLENSKEKNRLNELEKSSPDPFSCNASRAFKSGSCQTVCSVLQRFWGHFFSVIYALISGEDRLGCFIGRSLISTIFQLHIRKFEGFGFMNLQKIKTFTKEVRK